MQKIISKIEQWAEEKNILAESDVIDRAIKLVKEFGELSLNIGKGEDYQNDIGDILIGDIFIVLALMAIQLKLDMSEAMQFSNINTASEKQGALNLSASLSYFADKKNFDFLSASLQALSALCDKAGYNLAECVERSLKTT